MTFKAVQRIYERTLTYLQKFKARKFILLLRILLYMLNLKRLPTFISTFLESLRII